MRSCSARTARHLSLLALWQFIASLRLVQPEYFPTATTVIRVAASLLTQPAFLAQVLGTLGAMLLDEWGRSQTLIRDRLTAPDA